MHRKISLAPMKKLQGTSCTGQSCAMKVCPAHVEGGIRGLKV